MYNIVDIFTNPNRARNEAKEMPLKIDNLLIPVPFPLIFLIVVSVDRHKLKENGVIPTDI